MRPWSERHKKGFKKPMTLIYQINRSKRRRHLALKVSHGELIVHAPLHVSESQIQHLVEAKRVWINKHLQQQRQQLIQLQRRQWMTGERLRWLSEPLELQVSESTRKQVMRQGPLLCVTTTARSNREREPRLSVIQWYKQQAHAWLDTFFAHWPHHDKLSPTGWSVGDFRSKWGHCTRRGELKFTWKLWIAPEWVVRNVVIHELCHLKEFNHSDAFWQLVAHYSPDYQDAERWLRRHGVTVLSADYLDYAV